MAGRRSADFLGCLAALFMITAAPPVAVPPGAHHSLIPHWLTNLGPLGLFAVAVLDSSVIPLPLPGSTDLLLLWLVSHHGNLWLLVASATAGSILGGYTNWTSGKRSGETALQGYLERRRLTGISAWVKNHSIMAVFLPALLPPPLPMSAFLIAAGALGVSRRRFLVAFGTARVVRYGLVAWLALAYGRHVVRFWSGNLQKWSAPVLWVFGGMLVSGIGYGIWRIRRQRSQQRQIDLAVGQPRSV